MIGLAGLAALPFPVASRSFSTMRSGPIGPFSFCLNTSTVRGQGLNLTGNMELAAQAGYDGVEIWVRDLQQYVEQGGNPEDIARLAADLGLRIENAIGFAAWIVDDPAARQKALEQAKREMDLLARAGCHRLAAPPAGATDTRGLDLDRAAGRYAALLGLGEKMGVMPQLEVWGFSKNLHTLPQVLYVAAASGHPGARILPDIYHLHRGGSGFEGLKLVSGRAIEVFHLNDYPAAIPADQLKDGDRVYPGAGDAPILNVLRDLQAAGGPKVLSLELFNQTYWAQDALLVARRGLESMRSLAEEAVRS